MGVKSVRTERRVCILALVRGELKETGVEDEKRVICKGKLLEVKSLEKLYRGLIMEEVGEKNSCCPIRPTFQSSFTLRATTAKHYIHILRADISVKLSCLQTSNGKLLIGIIPIPPSTFGPILLSPYVHRNPCERKGYGDTAQEDEGIVHTHAVEPGLDGEDENGGHNVADEGDTNERVRKDLSVRVLEVG